MSDTPTPDPGAKGAGQWNDLLSPGPVPQASPAPERSAKAGNRAGSQAGEHGRVPCPRCAELIQPAAKVCRFCGHVLPVVDVSFSTKDPEVSTRAASPVRKRPGSWRNRGDKAGTPQEARKPGDMSGGTALLLIVVVVVVVFGGIPLALTWYHDAEVAAGERRAAALAASTPVPDPVEVISLKTIPPELCGVWIVTRVCKRNPAIAPGSVLFIVTPEWVSESTSSPVLRATDIMSASKSGLYGGPLVSFTAGGPLILVEHKKGLPPNQRVVAICQGRISAGLTVPTEAIVDMVEVSIFQGQR
jgi:hypothetical protein